MFDLIALAQECAPEIPEPLILAIAEQESSNNPFAIGHPSMSQSSQPKSKVEAIAIADNLAAKGERYDAGLMQISSANFNWLGLTNQTVMDPCINLAAAQKVIIEGLNVEGKDAISVFNSISRYNSGNANTGYKNGYVLGVTTKLVKTSALKTEKGKYESRTAWDKVGNTKGLFSLSVAQDYDNNQNNIFALPTTENNNEEPVTAFKVQRLGEEHTGGASTVALINPSSQKTMDLYN